MVGWIESVMTSSCSFEEVTRVDRAARQHAVGDIGGDAGGAVLQQRLGRVDQRTAGIDDVVDQKTVLAARRRR